MEAARRSGSDARDRGPALNRTGPLAHNGRVKFALPLLCLALVAGCSPAPEGDPDPSKVIRKAGTGYLSDGAAPYATDGTAPYAPDAVAPAKVPSGINPP